MKVDRTFLGPHPSFTKPLLWQCENQPFPPQRQVGKRAWQVGLARADGDTEVKKPVANPAGIDSRIAKRVRTLRADRGASLEILAEKSGVSRSMISLIERGESSPTAVILERLATGLGVSLATLFEDSSAPVNPLSRGCDHTPWRDPESGYVRRNISPPNFPSPIQLVEIVLPAGAKVAYDTSAREVSIHQQIWVQTGSIEVRVGKEHYCLAQDDCLAMRLNEPTTFHNRTRKPARYVVVLATEHSRLPRS